MKWNIIWQVDPDDLSSCIERDWFYEILSLVPIGAIRIDYQAKPLLSLALPYAIIGASCPNQSSQSDLIQYLQDRPKPRVLYHMSDEMVEVGHDLYQHCELVIRNGSANFEMFGDPKFIQIPLGYVSGLRNGSQAFRKSSERRCAIAFLGTLKGDRGEMLRAFQRIEGPSFVRKTQSFADATRHFGNSTSVVYGNAVFVPCPKGNWNPECNRLYDALEWGCIPLIKDYHDSGYHQRYHDKLLGRHPLPTFGTWEEAADFTNTMLSDKHALDALQAETVTWWASYKRSLQAQVANRLTELAASAS